MATDDVFRFRWGKNGPSSDTPPGLSLTPMYDPAVRCKWFRRAGGERSCINVSGLQLEHLLRAIMDISARAFSLADRPRLGPFGSPVFACAGKTEPPSRLILSQTLAGNGLIGLRHRLLLISLSSFVRAKGRSFVPARRTSIASRAGAVKAGRCAWLAAGSGVARLRLDRPEHGARIKRVGRLHRQSSSARRRVL